MSRVIPMGNRIVVRKLEKVQEDKLVGGIIIPGSADGSNDSRHIEAEVITVGKGVKDFKTGDLVVFGYGDELTIRGEKVYILDDTVILAKIN